MKALRLKTELWASSCCVPDHDVRSGPSLACLASPADRRIIFDKEPNRLLGVTPEPFFQCLADVTGNIRFFIWPVPNSAKRLSVASCEKAVTMATEGCPNWCLQLGRNRQGGHTDFSPSASISAIIASASFNACVRVQSISR